MSHRLTSEISHQGEKNEIFSMKSCENESTPEDVTAMDIPKLQGKIKPQETLHYVCEAAALKSESCKTQEDTLDLKRQSANFWHGDSSGTCPSKQDLIVDIESQYSRHSANDEPFILELIEKDAIIEQLQEKVACLEAELEHFWSFAEILPGITGAKNLTNPN